MTVALAEAQRREAERLLARLIERAHVIQQMGNTVVMQLSIGTPLFDRLSIWGAAKEDIEDDDPLEDDGTAEEERGI